MALAAAQVRNSKVCAIEQSSRRSRLHWTGRSKTGRGTETEMGDSPGMGKVDRWPIPVWVHDMSWL